MNEMCRSDNTELVARKFCLHGFQQLLPRKGFGQRSPGSQLGRNVQNIDGAFEPAARHRNDSNSRMCPTEFTNGFQAVFVRHKHVEQDQIRQRVLKLLEPPPALTRFQDRITLLVEGPSQGIADTGVVIDNEDRWHDPSQTPIPC